MKINKFRKNIDLFMFLCGVTLQFFENGLIDF